MDKKIAGVVAGIGMIIGGIVLYVVFRDVETPVVGLRQAGAVIAVLGTIELAATWWGTKRPQKR